MKEFTVGKTGKEKFQILLNCNFLARAPSVSMESRVSSTAKALEAQAAVHPDVELATMATQLVKSAAEASGAASATLEREFVSESHSIYQRI